ncbi:MAG: DUF3783 domain-containing protein [Eubacterium sp.]|nr:DUF3783 domain-containing protein [Eubacterium sp.]
MEKLLLVQVDEAMGRQISRLASNKKIRVINIEKNDIEEGKPLGAYLGMDVDCQVAGQGLPPDKSLVVFAQVTPKHFDKLLFEMRSKGLKVDYKAVLTPTNGGWDLTSLYEELEKERKSFE